MTARWDQAMDALGVRGPWRRDVLLAVVVALVSALVLLPVLGPLAAALGVTFSTDRAAVIMVLVVGQALLLAVRRTHPVFCLLAVALLQVALAATVPVDTTLRLVAPVLAAYAAGTRLPVRRLAGWVISAAVLDIVGSELAGRLLEPRIFPAEVGIGPVAAVSPALLIFGSLVTLLSYLSAALIGVVVANRRVSVAADRDRAAAAMREQAASFEHAARAERARMARELHDIAAHHLSGLVVQAAAAERLIELDPEAAREATRSIRAQGKEALGNLRLVVGVLRDRPDPGVDDAAVSAGDMVSGLGIASISRLVDHARSLDQSVTSLTRGEPRQLAPVADVTAYRIVQEGLSNARQHAPGAPVEVMIIFGDHDVRVEIGNPLGVRSAASPERGMSDRRSGFGILGMKERAVLAGGTVEAGLTESGGWRVSLVLPAPDLSTDSTTEQTTEQTTDLAATTETES